jgi:hypothetical protein
MQWSSASSWFELGTMIMRDILAMLWAFTSLSRETLKTEPYNERHAMVVIMNIHAAL